MAFPKPDGAGQAPDPIKPVVLDITRVEFDDDGVKDFNWPLSL